MEFAFAKGPTKAGAWYASFTYDEHALNQADDLFNLNYGLVGSFKCTLGSNC